LNKAVVFTIVAAIPADNGNFLLRPNYFGSVKYFYDVRNVNFTVLPGITPRSKPKDEVDLSWVASYYAPEKLKLDHTENWVDRNYHPADNMPDYGADVAIQNNLALLRLMYADVATTAEGKCATYRFLEVGIDHLAAMRQGTLPLMNITSQQDGITSF